MPPSSNEVPFERMAHALESLSERDREILILRRVQGLTRAEVAGILRRSVSTIYRRDRRADINLFQILRDRSLPQPLIAAKEVVEQVNSLSPELIDHLRQHTDDFQKLPADVFEHLIAELLAQRGFTNVFVVGRDKWTGADIIAMKQQVAAGVVARYFVEAKRWRRTVGIQVIREVLGAYMMERPRYGWGVGMVVTTSRFARSQNYTTEELKHMGIELRDGKDIEKWAAEWAPTSAGLWLPSARNRQARATYSL